MHHDVSTAITVLIFPTQQAQSVMQCVGDPSAEAQANGNETEDTTER